MTETQSDDSQDRIRDGSHMLQHDNSDYNLDNTMVLLIGLKSYQCDSKKLMRLCDKEIGLTQLVTIHSVDGLDLSKEYIQQYKDDGRDYCAVVLFRSYKKKNENKKLQKSLLRNGITYITLGKDKYLVTHRQGFDWWRDS